MGNLTFLDPSWQAQLKAFVREFEPDSLGNGDNVALCIGSWVAMLADVPGFHKPDKVLRKFFGRLIRDYRGTIAAGASLAVKLENSVPRIDGVVVPISLHKEFGRWPIFREYKKWFDTGDDSIWQFLLTFLNWGKKAEYVDPTLNEKSLADWLAIESKLCRLDVPEFLLDDLRFILSHLPNPDMSKINLKFGQKRVSEAGIKTYSQKLPMRYHASVDEILDLLPHDSPLHQLVIPAPELWRLGLTDEQQASIDYATWLCVYKDYKSVRSISKEPNTLMLAQQGVMSLLLNAIRHSPFRRIIDISDQSKNQQLCLAASFDAEYDTLDLSWASDSCSNRVVKRIFPPLWSNLFQATRSRRVKLPNGRIKVVEKFAPMGSALCFPVQTLVFTAVICLARFIVEQGCDIETYLAGRGPTLHRLKVDWTSCVYGDDIICRSSDTRHVVSLLETLGFTINSTKSFVGQVAFRESCGMFALDGRDVTPILFKVKGLVSNDLEWVDGLISLCNRLFMAGYVSTHAFLAGYLPKFFYVEVPFEGHLPTNSFELISDAPEQFKHHRRRFNTDLQRDEVRIKRYTTSVVPIVPRRTEHGLPPSTFASDVIDMHSRYQYARFLQAPSSHEGAKPPVGDVAQPTIGWHWVPVR